MAEDYFPPIRTFCNELSNPFFKTPITGLKLFDPILTVWNASSISKMCLLFFAGPLHQILPVFNGCFSWICICNFRKLPQDVDILLTWAFIIVYLQLIFQIFIFFCFVRRLVNFRATLFNYFSIHLLRIILMIGIFQNSCTNNKIDVFPDKLINMDWQVCRIEESMLQIFEGASNGCRCFCRMSISSTDFELSALISGYCRDNQYLSEAQRKW